MKDKALMREAVHILLESPFYLILPTVARLPLVKQFKENLVWEN